MRNKTAWLLLFIIALIPSAFAQSPWPNRAVRVVVPFPPGGNTDVVARLLAPRLAEEYGQPFVVDNRGGAGGTVGAEAVARAAPDGHTLIVIASTYASSAALYNLPYDPVSGIAPVGIITVGPLVLAAHPGVKANNLKEFVELLRAKPGAMSFGSSGTGSVPHLAAELFRQMTRTEAVHVPYKGGGPAVTDLMGGHVQLFFSSIATTMPYLKGGKVKGIAVTSAKRSRSAPEFPTIAESGIPGYELYEWNALFAPAGTPAEIIARLNADFGKVLAAADVQEKLFEFGAEPTSSTAEQLQSHVVREMAKWDKVVKAMGIKAQ